MNSSFTRRQILGAAAALPAGAALARLATPAFAEPRATGGFSFVLLGDLHYDKVEHHDVEWLQREHAGDYRQVQNYSRITANIQPGLFSEVRAQVADNRMPFVLHAGDLVEGLCGSQERSAHQNHEAIDFVRHSDLKVPFLFCKGNHDVTGPGAREAFGDVILPYLTENLAALPKPPGGEALKSACFTFEHENALFAFFDAYDDASLAWLENTLPASKARHKFVLIHPPVSPYGARSTWHIYSKPREAEMRRRLLETLGRNRALVLGGHIHKYNLMARRTESGQFGQLAVSSVIPQNDPKVTSELQGVANYTPDQINVEANFSPDTEAERRASLANEAPFVRAFEYADAPGYAIIHVRPNEVTADLYTGVGKRLWKSRGLTDLLKV